ncbi:MAG TPA: hypothetical protein VF053_19505 [Streptosporangiales bacterium]
MDPSSSSPHTIGRRRLFQAAGLGAGVAAASAVFGASSAAAAAPRAAAAPTATADLPLVGGPDFPIGLFWPPPPFETTLARYQEIADAGFTFLVTGNYLFDEYIGRYALGIADQVGLKVLIADDPRVLALGHYLTVTDDRTVPSSITTADAKSWMSTAFGNYTGHASFAGFNIYDEPAQSRFANVGALIDLSRQLQPNLLPYANLWPGNGSGYKAFVQSYIDTAKPSLLSFDRYPILTSGIDINYFDNWAIYRDASLRTGLPAWTYIQSVGYNGHRTPNATELAWQVNVSLAYGCKGIQYFTYWTPDPARGEGFHDGIISVDGKRTALYGAARALNKNWLQPVGKELKPLVSESVQHANESPLPPSTVGFTPGDYLTSASGSAAIVALFRPAEDDGTRWLLVANRDPNQAASVSLGVNGSVSSVARFVPSTGQYAGMGHPATLDISLDAGGAALYRLSR